MSSLKRDISEFEVLEVKRSKAEQVNTKKLRCGLTWCGEDNWHQNPKRGHPERPDRVGCIVKHLDECDLLKKCEYIDFSKWNDDEKVGSFVGSAKLDAKLEAVHNPYYLTRFSPKRFNKLVTQTSQAGEGYDGLLEEASQYDSIYLADKSADAARRAVAASLALADALVDNRIANGFAIVRPPGHHAEPCAAKGFCLFNNVGVVAKHLSHVKNERVHHGNGTATMFNNVSNPCYMSLHRHDEGTFFPGSSKHSSSSDDIKKTTLPHAASAFSVGEGEGVGHNVNIAWDGKGAGDMEYITAFQKVIIPIANGFQPTVILVSAGFDAAVGDPIGGCFVTPKGYGMLTRMLCECIPSAKGRVLLFLEGGYLLSVLPDCAKACVDVLVEVASKQHSLKPNLLGEDPTSSLELELELQKFLPNRKNVSPSKERRENVDESKDSDSVKLEEEEEEEEEEWTEGLLPSAVESIRDTIEAHQPHWPDVIF
jgi:acetoin utilization deacetylase AcuC-like enzyme